MSEFTQIIMRMLWRFYPIAWLTSAIVRGLSTITAWLEEEGYRNLLAVDRKECAWVGGWLALAEERLNELIVMKAMKLLKRPYRPPDPCGHHMARAVRTPQEIYRRLCRLITLYHDHKRLYELRAQKLQRLFAQAGLQLEAIHHPVAASVAVGVGGVGGVGVRGVAPVDRAGRHLAQPIRGPPWLALTPEKPAPSQPAGLTLAAPKRSEGGCESETSCLK